jgi:Arc/MetJ-type ribon-helix-helix transcriptional regulator
MPRTLDPCEIPEEVARFAEAQVAAGRFANIGEVLLAGKEALEERAALDAERTRLLRTAWDEGVESLRVHGPQLESDEDFDAFMDEAEAEALR